eukprot:TRINITY_DN8908_c0_g1_i3.p1 TRINITY_DN8908_c0_g1~~TRINITY_DN8908_c0_g1_i3.p1  ORF type:complete len:744 (-),score=183.33 TRINITY_DN8908_c0_g1_i3:59-2119(-)
MFSPKDEIGFVVYGTEDTSNMLMDDGYQHVTVLRDIIQPDVGLLRMIEDITPGPRDADLMDALIVAMDMLVRKTTGKRYSKRIFLVTNAGGPISLSDSERTDLIAQFEKMDAKLNVIGVDFQEPGVLPVPRSEKKKKNETFIREFADSVGGVVVAVHQALQMMSYFRGKSVLQRSAFRGCLEVSPLMKIAVWSFMKTAEQKFPPMKKLSAVSQQSANPKTMNVKLERSFYSLADPDQEVTKEEMVKGFKYGKGVVPFSEVDEAVLKYSGEKCLKVIGFAPVSSIPRHHLLSGCEAIVPEPGDKNAATGLSSLIHALNETESVAVVRYVKRNGGAPHLGFLSPIIKAEHEYLVYCSLPFSEDLRLYHFTPLLGDRARKSCVPSASQLAAARSIISSLDLMTAAEDEEGNHMEALKPRYTYNPVLQHHYQCLQARALRPEASLPPLDSALSNYITPDKKLFEEASEALKQFQEQFPLQRTERAESKLRRKFWGAKAMEDQEIRLESYVPDLADKKRKLDSELEKGLSLEKLVSSSTSDVGSVNPVQDFKTMLGRRDVDLVDKAIMQMKQRILQLVNDSIKDQFYEKAFACLQALREGCVKESESDAFNQFLEECRTYYMGKRRDDFWRSWIVFKRLTLVDSDETDDSSVTSEEAAAFLAGNVASVDSTPSQSKTKDSDEADDLFDQIE